MHTGTTSETQHAVETDVGGVVAEDGEGCGDGLYGNEDVDEFDEEGEEPVVDVIVEVPEGDAPEDGGHDAENGEDAPGIEHADAEATGVGEVEDIGVGLGATEEVVEAAGVIVKERLEVIEDNLLLADACEIL